MKKNNNYIINTLALFLLVMNFACEEIEIPGGEASDHVSIYMPAAGNNPSTIDLKYSDSTQTITYGAYYGGYGEAGSNINVEFEIAANLADSFNMENRTDYPLLPEESYTFTANSAIAKGKLSTEPLSIEITPEGNMELFKTYILPVTIKGISEDMAINEELRTAYFLVTASLKFEDFPDMDRSGWTVTEVSTEEPAEGQWGNGGLGIHTIDDNTSTFWHSKWDGGEAPPPHWLIIDMGQTNTLYGLSFIGRQSDNSGKPKNVVVEISNNATDWEQVGELTLGNTNDQQKYFLSKFSEGRYFKITVTSTHGDTQYTHLAELGAF